MSVGTIFGLIIYVMIIIFLVRKFRKPEVEFNLSFPCEFNGVKVETFKYKFEKVDTMYRLHIYIFGNVVGNYKSSWQIKITDPDGYSNDRPFILFPFNVKIGDKIKIDDHIIDLGKKLGKYTITFI